MKGNEAAYKTSYLAELPTRRDSVVDGINVSEMLNFLEGEMDCHATTNARLTGASGAIHSFDIVAKRGFETISVGFFQDRVSILDSPVAADDSSEKLLVETIKLGVKAMDCGSNLSFLVRLSSYLVNNAASAGDPDGSNTDPRLRDVLERFNVKLIEASDIETASRKLKKMLTAVDFSYAYKV